MKLAYVLIFLILSSFAHAGETETTNFATITVEGTGQTVTTPDVVRLGWTLSDEGQTASQAMSIMTKKSAKLMDKLEKFGLEAADVVSTDVRLSPVYKDNNYQRSEIRGFVASSSLKVSLRDLDRLAELYDLALQSGVTEMYGVTFDTTERDVHMTQAQQKAVHNARKKAELYAKEAGMRVGRLLMMSEIRETSGFQMFAARSSFDGEMANPNASGELTFTQSITAKYEIEPAE